MNHPSEDDRRHTDERPEWAWSRDLRDAYREAVSTVLDRNAVLVAMVPEAARPAPRRPG